jgi:hypothetical protein
VTLERTLYLYVDDRYVGGMVTAWPMKRVLGVLQARYPNATAHEVTVEPRFNEQQALDAIAHRRAAGSRAEMEARNEDPGR